jgi:hypothetical protein
VLVLTAAAFLPLTACSHGLDPDSPTALALETVDDPAAIAQLAQDAPAPQAAILEDGQVSDGEYEQALTAERDCVSAATDRCREEDSTLVATIWADQDRGRTPPPGELRSTSRSSRGAVRSVVPEWWPVASSIDPSTTEDSTSRQLGPQPALVDPGRESQGWRWER